MAFSLTTSRRAEEKPLSPLESPVPRLGSKPAWEEKVYLGNLEAKRHWGYAKEYVEAMWLMLQQEEPDDYVIASGQTHSVSELVEEAFSYARA